MENKVLKLTINMANMWSIPRNNMMLLLTTFMFLLPSVFVQETMTHVHSDDSTKHISVSVIPDKYFSTHNYESTLANSDNIGATVSDKPEYHHEHNKHNHDKESGHHSAHTFQDRDLSHRQHSMHNHDMHAHHAHSLQPTTSEEETENHENHKKNVEPDYDLLLQDQPAQDSINVQRNYDKRDSKDYNEDNTKHYMNDKLHNHHHDDANDMDHSDMSHHMHMNMNGSDGHGMMMYFQTGIEAIVLFKEWKITTIAELIGSMIGIMMLGTFYEALKYLREHLFRQYVSSMQFSTVAVTGESGRVTEVHKVESHRMLSWAHAMQTCLHVVQIVTSYFLMLIFMTYNVWLCIAVIVGSALGYFIFGWKKATIVDITEHCH